MEFQCPFCHSPIYSRKNKVCGVCEKPLPQELLLTDEQIALFKKQMDQGEEQEKQFKQQVDDLGPHDRGGNLGGIASF